MIPVAEALRRVLDLVEVLGPEDVPIDEAAGRVLARPVAARRAQPPFRAAMMDGYAVRGDEVRPGAGFRVGGEAAAGHAFGGRVGPGEAVRIFTGAPVPDGADRVVIQEDVRRTGDEIVLGDRIDAGPYIRPAGADFAAGDEVAPGVLTPASVALLAAMNVAVVPVVRRPVVALIATGDELVMPGEAPEPSQIIASNAFGLAALVRAAGAEVRRLPIARDTEASISAAFSLAAGADLIVTIGGASVGAHDLVAGVARQQGLEHSFHNVAMRPGKPLMAGRIGGSAMVGLPGNPVSSMVCGHVFILPAIRAMLGLGRGQAPRRRAALAAPAEANGAREHYMRGRLDAEGLVAAPRQDSALLSVLAGSDVLIVRPPHDPARAAGEMAEYLPTG